MTALIQSLVNGAIPVVGQSRNDLRNGDTVTLSAVNPASNYSWSIAFAPEDKDGNPSMANLAGNVFGAGPITFEVDYSGAYLIRLVVDAGIPATQDEQYVRLRFETVLGDLKLVAAGERRDGTGVIPVDISAEGWANDQNFNLKTLLCLVQHSAASGRIIYVDANRGKDSNFPADDPTIAEGWADFSTVSAGILAAQSNVEFNGGMPPTLTQPMIVAVRPGRYIEDITFAPFVHIIGWPQTGSAGAHPDGDRSVVLRCENVAGATHTASIPSVGEFCMVSNVMLENTGSTTTPLVQKSGEGDVYWLNTMFSQEGTGAINQGATYAALRGVSVFRNCRLVQTDTFTDTSEIFVINPAPGQAATIEMFDSRLRGTSLGSIDPNQAGGSEASFVDCEFEQVGTGGGEFAIQTWGLDLALDGCVMSVDPGGPVTTAIEANPGGAVIAGELMVRVRRSILGDSDLPAPSYLGISMDPTNVGVGLATLQLGSSEYGTITAPLPVVRRALTLGTSLFYDNTIVGLLTADNVQEALDDIAGAAFGAVSLNAAYNVGRIITVDADAVELHGTPLATTLPPLAPLPPTGDGVLRVYNQVEIGAINDWEMNVAPNWANNGPSILGGNLNWNTDSVLGSAFSILSLATLTPDWRNFNLRIGAADAQGDSVAGSIKMGNVWVRGGGSLCGSGAVAPDGGDVAIIAGGVEEPVAAPGIPGNVWLHPGYSNATTLGGSVNVVDATAATPATLTAAAVYTEPNAGAPAGTLTFATVAGRVDVVFAGGENLVAMQGLFSTGTGLQLSQPGGNGTVLVLTSSAQGPDSEILLVNDSTGGSISLFLGDMTISGGALFVAGTYPDFVELRSTGSEVLQIGTTNPMIYDAILGKLTVPGFIDPTAMIFDEFGEATIPTGANKGAIFVSDGTGGATATNSLYYKDEGGALTNLLLGGGGGAPTTSDYLTITDETGTLPNSLRIAGTAGEIVFNQSGSQYVASLVPTGSGAGTANHANIVFDATGRISSALPGTKTISRQMMVPVGVTIPPDFVVCEFDFFADSFTPTGVWVYLDRIFTGVVATDIKLDVLGRGAAAAPGAPVSFFAAEANLGALPATQGTFIPISAGPPPGTLIGPVVIQIKVSYLNTAPTDGGGLVVSVVGTL
jgi:hypothetical protein